MSKSCFAATFVLATFVLVGAAPQLYAFESYSTNVGDMGGCADCHGAFNENDNYFSHGEGIFWGDDLHGVHFSHTDIESDCDNCHGGTGTSGREVKLVSSGNAADGVNAIACMGCHGRLEDSLDDIGAGLRAHHMAADGYINWPGGIPGFGLTCADCHAGDPATPVGESTAPPWYASVMNTSIMMAMDACSADGQEDFSSNGTGTDNDGDDAYDVLDSDCAAASVPGDMNGDGVSDILWRNANTGESVVWLMDSGMRAGQEMLQTTVDTTWRIVGRGDYNGDGTADVLWRRANPGQANNGQMAIWLMQGGTRTANLPLLTVANDDWQVVGDGDYNGDGESDVLWRNVANGSNAIWQFNAGALTANLLVPAAGDTNWRVVANGDFDADGKDDIVWRHDLNGQMALWRMNGATRLANLALPTVIDVNWSLMGDGDYNADDKQDLFWRNTDTGQNAMWLMNGSVLMENLPVLSFGNQDWVIGGDGDFDGDGDADLYWHNSLTGDNSTWLMNGATREGHFYVPPVTNGWAPASEN